MLNVIKGVSIAPLNVIKGVSIAVWGCGCALLTARGCEAEGGREGRGDPGLGPQAGVLGVCDSLGCGNHPGTVPDQ